MLYPGRPAWNKLSTFNSDTMSDVCNLVCATRLSHHCMEFSCVKIRKKQKTLAFGKLKRMLLKQFFHFYWQIKSLITQYMLINEWSMTTDCGTKTSNEHSTSEYDLHKCNFKNSSDWTIQIKAFELLSDTHKKNCRSWRQWCVAPATSFQLLLAEDLLKRMEIAELVPDQMSWCESCSQNSSLPSVSLFPGSKTQPSSWCVRQLYNFTIVILTSQQLVVYNLPNHPFSEIWHMFLSKRKEDRHF